MVSIDYYSDFWELDQLPDTLSTTVITRTKAHFAHYGIPDKVITDNGPQFRSQEYERFAKDWDFTHITSSPYHSQSNGKAEAAVKIAKHLIRKASKDHQDPYLSILNWRNTPTEGSEYSPAQKLHSRRTRTLLPTTVTLLQPAVAKHVEEEIRFKRQRTKLGYDKAARSLPELRIGQGVRIQPVEYGGEWKKATVVRKVGERSYLTRTESGSVYRRNRKFLRVTDEEITELNVSDKANSEVTVDLPTTPIGTPIARQEQPEEITSDPSTVPGQHRTERESTSDSATEITHPPSEQAAQTIIRSGRSVRPPARYNDFINIS